MDLTSQAPENRQEPSIFIAAARPKPDRETNPAGELGWYLQKERENRGLSLDDVSASLGIHPYHLEAIEYGDLTSMPPRLDAMEMIVAYAESLGFERAPLVEHLLTFLPPPPLAPRAVEVENPPLLRSAKILSFGQLPKLPRLNIRFADYPGGSGGILASACVGVMFLLGGISFMTAEPSQPNAGMMTAENAPLVIMPNDATTASAEVKVSEAKIEDDAAMQMPRAAEPTAEMVKIENDDLGNLIFQNIPEPQEKLVVSKSSKKYTDRLPTLDVETTASVDKAEVAVDGTRLILQATAPVYLRIEDKDGNIVMAQNMNTGESYKVPMQEGLIARARDGGRVKMFLDGKEIGMLGKKNEVVRNAPLDFATGAVN